MKIISIGNSEIPINILYINTVPGVVGAIRIATTSSSTAATSSMTTASVGYVALTESTTTTYYSSFTGPHLWESIILLLFDSFIWKYLGDLTGQVGHCIDKIMSMHIWSNALAIVHLWIIRPFYLLCNISWHLILWMNLNIVIKYSKSILQ